MRILSSNVLVGGLIFIAANAPAAVLYVNLTSTNPTSPYASWGTAATNIQDAIDASTNGDLILVTNGVYQTGGRLAEGSLTNRVAVTRPVTVQSVNGPGVTVIRGYTVPVTLYGTNAVRCVYLTNGATLAGFTLTNGDTQNFLVTYSSIDSASGGVYCDSTNALIMNCVIVSNTASGSCASDGGTLSNCIVANNNGGSAVYSALLINCTVTNNSGYGGVNTCTANNCILANNSGQQGGGALYSVLNNCFVSGNIASAYGGGAYDSTLNNCILTNNRAGWGGGAISSTLNNCLVVNNLAYSQINQPDAESLGGGTWGGTANNCTIAGNEALRPNSSFGGLEWQGGGAFGGTLNNCIIFNNFESPGYIGDSYYNYYPGTLNNCCTAPQPNSGYGNFVNNPLLINQFAGNFHLQSNSPCINAGNNAFVSGTNDLDGNPRIKGGTVDIGAYEFQSPSSVLSYAWAQQYGLPTDGSADYLDSDGDGMNNWQEWIAGTIPTNAASVLALQTPGVTTTNATITWQSVAGINYFIQRGSDLGAQPPFSTIQSNIVGLAGTTSYIDTNAVGSGPFFYRVGVQH
jgi:hypothetical protein